MNKYETLFMKAAETGTLSIQNNANRLEMNATQMQKSNSFEVFQLGNTSNTMYSDGLNSLSKDTYQNVGKL